MDLQQTGVRIYKDDLAFLKSQDYKLAANVREFLHREANALRLQLAMDRGLVILDKGVPTAPTTEATATAA